MEESSERSNIFGSKEEGRLEPVKHAEFLKALSMERQGDERILPAASKFEHRLANTGILAQQDPCQKSTELKV